MKDQEIEWKSIGELIESLNSLELPSIQSTYFLTLQSLKKYYQTNEKEIIKYPYRWFMSYPMDWYSVLTPIEWRVWEVIRITGRVILYPQYPVLNYYLDFANPGLKIAVEADGKDFHQDKEKDLRRDQELLSHGWRVFRISGSKINYNPEPLDREMVFEEEYKEYQNTWYKTTLEGFIYALRVIYFDRIKDDEEAYMAMEVLKNHRLANFSI